VSLKKKKKQGIQESLPNVPSLTYRLSQSYGNKNKAENVK